MYSESNDKSSQSTAEVYTDFYAWRRQYLDEILFNNNIPTQVKLFAIDLGFSINRKSRASYEGYARFAKRLHLKLRVVRDAAEWLRSDGRLKIEQRYGKQHLEPLTKGDAPFRSTGGGKNFYASRGAFCEAILRCDLTSTARIVYCGIAALTDPATGKCAEGQAAIGGLIGVPRRTMTEAIYRLGTSGVLRAAASEGAEDLLTVLDPRKGFKKADPSSHPSNYSSKYPSNHPSNRDNENPNNTGIYAATSAASVTSGPFSTYGTAPTAAPQGRPQKISFTWEEWERFDQLVGLIVDHSSGDRSHKTLAGIMAVSGAVMHRDHPGGEVGTQVYEHPYYPDEITKFVNAGVLSRDGDRIQINDFTWHCVDWIKQQRQLAA